VTFLRPDVLAVAPVAALLVSLALTAQWHRGRRLAEAYGGFRAARRLTRRALERYPWARLVCLLGAVLTVSVAAAGPDRDQGDAVEPGTPIDLVVAVDVSMSMSARDVNGTRIARATTLLEQLANALSAERIALSLFADWPYGLVPLTDDPEVVRFFLPSVAPELMNRRDQGTSVAAAVAHAGRVLEARSRPETRRIVLLVTDGETHGQNEAIMDSIAAAAANGTTVWTAGIGTRNGATLLAPVADGAPEEGTPLLDESGQPVVAGYDEALLREMASVGGGAFHDVSNEAGARALVRALRNLTGQAEEERSENTPVPWLPLIALPLLLWDSVSDSGRRLARVFVPGADDE